MKAYTLDNQRALYSLRPIMEDPRHPGRWVYNKKSEIIGCDDPPASKEYEKTILHEDNKTWAVKPDYRNVKFYSKKTGEEQPMITEIGKAPDSKLYTLKPKTNFYQKYDDITDTWIDDVVAKKEAEKQQKLNDLKYRMDMIDIKKIRPLTAMTQGTQSSDDTDAFNAYEAELESLRSEYNKIKNEN